MGTLLERPKKITVRVRRPRWKGPAEGGSRERVVARVPTERGKDGCGIEPNRRNRKGKWEFLLQVDRRVTMQGRKRAALELRTPKFAWQRHAKMASTEKRGGADLSRVECYQREARRRKVEPNPDIVEDECVPPNWLSSILTTTCKRGTPDCV